MFWRTGRMNNALKRDTSIYEEMGMFVHKYLSDRCSAISIMFNSYKYNNICRQERGAKRAKRYETAK